MSDTQNQADESDSGPTIENRLNVLERYLDWIEDDRLNYRYQLWVRVIEQVLVVFGAVIVSGLVFGATGVQSWEVIFSWFDTLMDVIIGTIAVLSFIIYATYHASERWFNWRWSHFSNRFDDEEGPS